MNVPAWGWKATRWPAATASAARSWTDRRGARPSRRRSGPGCRARPPGRRAPRGRATGRGRCVRTSPPPSWSRRSRSRADRRSRRASVRRPSPGSTRRPRPVAGRRSASASRSALALREADAELGALVPGPGDLVEDRQRVRAVPQVGEVDVVPQDRHRPDRGARQGVAGPAQRGPEVGLAHVGRARSSVLLLGHAGRPSRALLGMVLRARGVPPAGLVGSGRRQVAIDHRRGPATGRPMPARADGRRDLGRVARRARRGARRRARCRRRRGSRASRPASRKSVQAERPKNVSWPPLMLIQPELSRTTAHTGVPARTAVWSSCIDCRKLPSPEIETTWRSGFASWAPIAAGSSKPIVEKPPDVMWVRGARVTQRCLTMPCGRPAPVTTIASSRVARLDLADGARHRHRHGRRARLDLDLLEPCRLPLARSPRRTACRR